MTAEPNARTGDQAQARRPEPFPRPLRLRLGYLFYQVLIHLLLPLYLLALLWRSRKEPLYRARLAERFGFWPRTETQPVWIFAASLGETRAISPLVRLLLNAGYQVTLTHSSPAGLTTAQALFPDAIASGQLRSGYVPLDLFWSLGTFLRRQKPQIGVVVEMELWPGQVFEAYRRGVPMITANGNYIQKSLKRDQKGLALRPLLLLGFSRILTKSQTRRATYLEAGVPEDRIRLVGELKFDQSVEPAQLEKAALARLEGPAQRRVFMIASSVEAEEDELFDLVDLLLKSDRPPLILWVPRSPQRFASVAERLERSGANVALRSDCFDEQLDGTIRADADVLIGDSLGEMTFYYGLSDLVFVGASLVEHGGHNIIEPLAQGKPVLMGWSIYGVAFPAYEAAEAGAFESLPDGRAIARRVLDLFDRPEELAQMSRAAASFNADHTGAAARTLEEMKPYMATNPTSSGS